jgi:hypothetical protein
MIVYGTQWALFGLIALPCVKNNQGGWERKGYAHLENSAHHRITPNGRQVGELPKLASATVGVHVCISFEAIILSRK